VSEEQKNESMNEITDNENTNLCPNRRSQNKIEPYEELNLDSDLNS